MLHMVLKTGHGRFSLHKKFFNTCSTESKKLFVFDLNFLDLGQNFRKVFKELDFSPNLILLGNFQNLRMAIPLYIV